MLQEGNMIHLFSRQGMFTVVSAHVNGVYISCQSWIARAGYPDTIPTKFVEFSDVKCLAGGHRNFRNVKTVFVDVVENTFQLEGTNTIDIDCIEV